MTFRGFTSFVLNEFAKERRQLKQLLMADLTALLKPVAGKIECCGSEKAGGYYAR